MYASVLFAAVAATGAMAAPVQQRGEKSAPAGWAIGYLEEYSVYHERYLALSCQTQHNTSFFDDCCHPLLATETLADRPAYCTPNATEISSAAEYASTATWTATADVEAASQYVSVATASPSASPSIEAAGQWAQDKQAEATPTSTWVAPSSTSEAPAPAETSQAPADNNSGGNVETGGFATYFYQNGNPGACGNYHSDSDKIIAIDSAWWPNFGQPSEYCGRWISITNTNNGKTVSAQVADVCPTCVNGNSLDLSVGAFTAIATEDEGSVPISWHFQ